MSKADFDQIRKVSHVLEGFKALDELVGEAPQVHLSDAALKKWGELEAMYNRFYSMNLHDRIAYSEMNSPEALPSDNGLEVPPEPLPAKPSRVLGEDGK